MQRLRLLTLNIWNRQGPWEQRLPLIRRGIEALRPDIIGVQEVLGLHDGAGGEDQAAEIVRGLETSGYRTFFAPAWTIGGTLRMGNAIIARAELADCENIALPTAAGAEGRSVAFARVRTEAGAVPVFVTHLPWKLHESHLRCEHVRFVVERIKERAPVDGFPPVLMGDMNAEPDSDEMRFLRGLTPLGGKGAYFADCWEAVAREHPGAGPGFTYHRGNHYALRSREPSRRIDYIYVRGPDRKLRGEPLTARVVFDRPQDGVFASDHYGLYAEIQAAERAHDPF